MKVLLLNPPFKTEHGKFSREQRSPAITKSGTFYYPMWLAFATGLLEKNGHVCQLMDSPARGYTYDDVIANIKFSPDLIVVATSTPSIDHDVNIAASLKKKYGSTTVMVGNHATALPEQTLQINPQVDAVAREEFEEIVSDLAALLEQTSGHPSKEQLQTIDGLTFRFNGEVVVNKERKPPQDLDAIPFVSKVYKEHLNYKDYFYSHSKYPIITLVTGRGCPYQCVYCVYPQVFSGHKMRYRSINNVVDEIEYVLKEFPDLKEIMFEDDTLTVNRQRSRDLAEEIIRRGLKFNFSANSRADVDLETLKLLKKAGCRLFCVGIESGVQDVLDQMKKSLKVDKIRQFFGDTKKAGILVHGCFMLGNPGETKETLRKTLDFAKELNPDTAQFFPIMVYPGTEAYEWATKNGYLETTNFNEWLSEDGMHNCVVSRPGLSSQDLVDFCDRARIEFYVRASYVVRKFLMGFRDFDEFKRLARGAKHLIRHLRRETALK